jgi:3-oxoacyl-[acyl-carrier protein] reductase
MRYPKTATKQVAHHGVRVNAIQPGLIRGDDRGHAADGVWDQKMDEIPMRRAARSPKSLPLQCSS